MAPTEQPNVGSCRKYQVRERLAFDLRCCTIADVATEEEAAATAVRLFRDRKAQSLMKGSA